jgi:hypothetical protein
LRVSFRWDIILFISFIIAIVLTLNQPNIAAILTYASKFGSGELSSGWPHFWLLFISVLASFAVGAGILLERPEYSAYHSIAFWLVIIGIAIEACCTIFLFVFDEGISAAQRDPIAAQQGRIIELDGKTAVAEADAAKANKETAMINERAAQLQGALELENKKQQGRTLTREQIKTFADHVRGKVSKVYIVSRRDLESIMFDAQIATMFREANVPIGIGGTFDGGFPFQGVRVASKTFTDLQSFVSDPIVGAFFAIGIMPDGGAPQGVVDLPNDGPVIFVGEKPLDLGLPFPLPAIPAK